MRTPKALRVSKRSPRWSRTPEPDRRQLSPQIASQWARGGSFGVAFHRAISTVRAAWRRILPVGTMSENNACR